MSNRTLGPYRLENLIGKGGMGEVYRAVNTRLDRTVALKVLSEELSADEEFRERFRRESQIIARLREPHVISIHDYGDIDGRLYLDMEYVEGVTLGQLIERDGATSFARAVELVSQVARALDATHACGVVHRDVKPSNVLVSSDGTDRGDHAYLIDFGIARSVRPTAELTRTGQALGTYDFMAPERFLGQPVDHRTDVYSLACVLFECLTGRRPFPIGDLPAVIHAHVNQPPPAPSDLRPGLPGGIDAVIARGMAKNPADRYPSAGALAVAARAALDPATTASPAPGGVGVTPASTTVTGRAGWPAAAEPARSGRPPTTPKQRTLRDRVTRVAAWTIALLLFGGGAALGYAARPIIDPSYVANPAAPVPAAPNAESSPSTSGASGVEGIPPDAVPETFRVSLSPGLVLDLDNDGGRQTTVNSNSTELAFTTSSGGYLDDSGSKPLHPTTNDLSLRTCQASLGGTSVGRFSGQSVFKGLTFCMATSDGNLAGITVVDRALVFNQGPVVLDVQLWRS